MTLPVEVVPLFEGNRYPIQRSLRFRSSASAYLNRTMAMQATRTLSLWIKRGAISVSGTDYNIIFNDGSTGDFFLVIGQASSPYPDKLRFTDSSGTPVYSSGVLRDPSSWYHIVVSQSSSATSVYINGVLNNSNARAGIAIASSPMKISHTNTTQSFDGYMAEINYIDGQALDPTYFGYYNEFGVWSPRKYGGSYGTNGFYLPFTDTSALTSSLTGNVGLGRDFSGNSNYWITNNISIAGSSYTSYTSGSGTYTVPAGITSINYLVVGGGGGGAYFGGGGGGGGVLAGQLSVTPGQTISYSVGGGGNGSTSNGTDGTNGTSSTFGSVTALGGGGGGSNTNNGSSGGSGGGGSRLGTGGAGATGQGFAGGNGTTNSSTYFNAGGGGGATAVGGNAIAVSGNTQGGGTGGAGYTWINGSVYGGGGGGGGYGANGGPGGSGGGGSGGGDFNTNTAGTANTGGGGGGGKSGGSGSNGGSGIIIISIGGSPTYDAMTDVPPPQQIQNGLAGNYCVLNPLFTNQTGVASGASGTAPTISNANLTTTAAAGSAQTSSVGSLGVSSGKWYFEYTPSAVNGTGDIVGFVTTFDGTLKVAGYRSTGVIYTNGSTSSGYATWTSGNVIGIALDIGSSTVSCYKDNVLQATLSLTNAITTFCYPLVWFRDASGAGSLNFGQRPFSYTPPSGFLPLNSNNLPAPTIPNGAKFMAAVTYAGSNSAQTITASATNSGNNPLASTFQPDFVWIKSRNTTDFHDLIDAVRGTDKNIYSNTNAVEDTVARLTSFNATGITLAGGYGYTNVAGQNFVAWEWNAGSGTTSTNTDGTITGTVTTCVNKSAGFSIVTYTGSGSNATVGHGLGAAPSMIFVKRRQTPPASADWIVYHTSIGAGNILVLNSTSAIQAVSACFNSTVPTSTVFSVGTDANTNYGSSNTYVAYCFAPVSGYSAFGSYTGNGSTDGPFIFTGFRARWVLIKNTASAVNWFLFDTSRNTYNPVNTALLPNATDADWTLSDFNMDILSNGFKIRTSNNSQNSNTVTYIYAAFAENPFKLALAR